MFPPKFDWAKSGNEIRKAESITVSVDDKSPYRLIRFKSCSSEGNIARGVIGLVTPLAHLMVDPKEWGRDKSEAAAQSIVTAISAFCTPLRQSRDEELFQLFLQLGPLLSQSLG